MACRCLSYQELLRELNEYKAKCTKYEEMERRMKREIFDFWHDREPVNPLTNREIEVIGLIIKGLSFREIGDLLGISERSAKSHSSNVYSKLGIKGRHQLAYVWHEMRGKR